MTIHIGAPDCKYQGVLVWPYAEDQVTAAWELVTQHRIDTVEVDGLPLPAWWERGSGVTIGRSKWKISCIRTREGVLVFLADEEIHHVQEAAMRALGQAREITPEEFEKLQRATGGIRDSDFPLGAHVTSARHDEVLLQRLKIQPGNVVTWTRIGEGAAPSEFFRLQEAEGAYTVVMVAHPEGRTVGIWAGKELPQAGDPATPILRRLYPREGAWRYGVVFSPSL